MGWTQMTSVAGKLISPRHSGSAYHSLCASPALHPPGVMARLTLGMGWEGLGHSQAAAMGSRRFILDGSSFWVGLRR